MATNKHAVIRYQALDKCFSNFGRRYYLTDLIEACNQAIYEFTGNPDGVKRRQVYEDISFMESEAGYSIPLERLEDGRKRYYRYADKNFSINKQPLSQTEAEQLNNTILMLNRFKGLPQFDWMEELMARLAISFNLKSTPQGVVAFEENLYLKGMEHFTPLFQAIINKQPLQVLYKPSFGAPTTYTLHPYFLKQYNNRWFLFGLNPHPEGGKVMNMAIDRIVSFEPLALAYLANTIIDFSDYFEEVVGVTVPYGQTAQRVLLRIDRARYNYIESKPLHGSQTELAQLSNETSVVVRLQLIPNYEFKTLLFGFADSIEVLEPLSLRTEMAQRARAVLEKNREVCS